jgi:transposase-like protein
MSDEADSVIDRVADLWRRGATLTDIARELGASRGSIARRIARERKAGDSRFRPRPPPPTKPRVLKPADENVGNRRARPAAAPPTPPPLSNRMAALEAHMQRRQLGEAKRVPEAAKIAPKPTERRPVRGVPVGQA